MSPGFGTPSVAIATAPTVVSTFFAHLFARRKRKQVTRKSLAAGGRGGGPENQLTYEEGLKLVKRFLEFASHHGVEEVQAFTAMPVPTPIWVRRKVVTIPTDVISRAEDILAKHLSTYGGKGEGLKLVGGGRWWRIRGRELEGEWVEMQKDYIRRKDVASKTSSITPTSAGGRHHHHLPRRHATHDSVRDISGAEVIGDRVILYIHGGAFFFSSLDTHRYQVQRHARKAGARAFSPAYRLAPQYPFPCGLLDSLASYLYLLDPPPGAHAPILPTSITLMGDSAGAGMIVSLLVIIREMGLPMPAGAALISPWVDLTHSMPSIGGNDDGDFIPSSGFHYKPSATWPPLPGDGIRVKMPDGSERQFDEQVQMYCSNTLLTHPLVSPVNQGSLGGLCPLLILGGGGELLRDEITYLAYKAAAPTTYTPSSAILAQFRDQAAMIDKYQPTRVHLQIYEGCCHVVPTLSWVSSSKYMYRACANFHIWAFTAAAKALEHRLTQKHSRSKLKNPSIASSPSNVMDDSMMPSPATMAVSGTQADGSLSSSASPSVLDLTKPIINPSAAHAANSEEMEIGGVESEASSDSEDSDWTDEEESVPARVVTVRGTEPMLGHAHIVSERVSTHGKIRPFEPIESIPALQPELKELIGQTHGDGALQKWLKKRAEWDDNYSSALSKWRKIRQEDRLRAEQAGFLTRDLQGENPPLASLAGWYDLEMARKAGASVDEIGKETSGAMMLWMKISSKVDKVHAGGENMDEIRKNVEEMKEERALDAEGVR